MMGELEFDILIRDKIDLEIAKHTGDPVDGLMEVIALLTSRIDQLSGQSEGR